MKKIEELISQPVIDFIALAQKYCRVIESAESMSLKDMQMMLVKLLPRIYIRIMNLPEINDTYSPDAEKYFAEKEYKKVSQLLISFFGESDFFAEITEDKLVNKKILVRSRISESLTDIYQDLTDFLRWYKYEDIESKNDALAELQRSFRTIWGEKLLFVMIALHSILFMNKKPDNLRIASEEDDDQHFDPSEMDGFSEDTGDR